MELQWKIEDWKSISKDVFYKCARLRIEVFVIEQDCPYQDFDLQDQHSYHVYATDELGDVMTYARIVIGVEKGNEVSIGRVIVHESQRRKNLGVELMNRCISYITDELEVPSIYISAQVYLTRFYQDLGFIAEGEEYLEDGIPHTEMLYVDTK